MTTTLPSGIQITEKNANEILSMGGPYIGTVSIGDAVISDDCVLGNYVETDDFRALFFIKFHKINSYQYFTINFYNQETKATFEFQREFDMLYLGRFLGKNELEIYPAFHDKFPEKKLIFDIDKEQFKLVQ